MAPKERSKAPAHPLSPAGHTFAILDTCVLLPPRLSDCLMDLGLENLYYPMWTSDIEAEYLRNWRRVVAQVAQGPAARRVPAVDGGIRRLAAFQRAFPCYAIEGYAHEDYYRRVPKQVDAKDAHVAAAALRMRDVCRTEGVSDKVFLISHNVRDLAVMPMRALSVSVITPGMFIDRLFGAARVRTARALERSLSDLSAPPFTRAALAELLQRHGAVKASTFVSRATPVT